MRVRLLGAVELPYEQIADQPLVELSGLAWDNDDEVLYALSDHGVLFHLTPVFAAGALVDAKVTHAFPLPGSDGKRLRGRSTDSEGLAILDGRNGIKGDAVLLISFEREPRVNRYSPVGNFVERHDLPQSLRTSLSRQQQRFRIGCVRRGSRHPHRSATPYRGPVWEGTYYFRPHGVHMVLSPVRSASHLAGCHRSHAGRFLSSPWREALSRCGSLYKSFCVSQRRCPPHPVGPWRPRKSLSSTLLMAGGWTISRA